MKKIKVVLTVLFLIQSVTSIGQIKLPKLISNGVVLQRDSKIPVWGWASPNEKITIHFNKKNYKTTAQMRVHGK